MSISLRTLSALTLLPLLASCAGEDGDNRPAAARPTPSASAVESPSPTQSPTPPASPAPTPTATGTSARAVYYLADTGFGGPRLYREFHARPATTAVLRDAVTAMLTEKPKDADYTSLWPKGSTVRGVRLSGTTAFVDLSKEAGTANAGAAAEAASIQQLVYTATAAAPFVKSVQILIEGKTIADLWGHVDTSKPIARRMAAEILGPVWITRPAGGSVKRGGEFGGEATVFEATVSWELLQGGKVVKKGFTNADMGAPARGPWNDIADVPPGDYVLRAFESSAEDGRPTFVDDKPLRVTP